MPTTLFFDRHTHVGTSFGCELRQVLQSLTSRTALASIVELFVAAQVGLLPAGAAT